MESTTFFRSAAAMKVPAASALPGPGNAPAAVLTVCDLSSAAIDATWRAAMVARELGLPLRVLHPVLPDAVRCSNRSFVDELRTEIPLRMAVQAQFEAVGESGLDAAVTAARDAALVVIPSRQGNLLREWIMGTQAERLIRLCRAPVLVVKRPALASYRRLLVAAALEAADAQLVELAAALAAGGRLDLLHVLDTDDEIVLRELDASAGTLQACREYRAQRAHTVLHGLLEPVAAEVDGVTSVEFGNTAAAILARAQARPTDLLVIGKRRRGLLADYFLGGATQRVLAGAQCDVLVLPIRPAAGRATPRGARAPAAQDGRLPERAGATLLHRS